MYRVPSLSLPEDSEHAIDSDAVRLFLDRAHSVRPDFSPSQDDLDAVVRICRRLDARDVAQRMVRSRVIP